MASPHVAGAGALLKNAMPSWTPDNIRSALMMTATTDMRKEDGVTPADWFDMGSGRINVDLAVQTGLVMDETAANYADANPNEGGDPRTLNLPSMVDSNCVGVCSFTRTVTATKDGSWTVSGASVTDGIEVTVAPASFDLTAGQSQELVVSIDVFDAPSDQWAYAKIDLQSASSPDLHMPISVVASTGNVPEEMEFTASRDQDSWLMKDLQAVEISDFTIRSYGLTKASVTEGTLAQDPTNGDVLDDLSSLSITEVTVGEDGLRLVAQITASEAPDLDLFIYHDANGDGVPTEDERVGASTSGTAAEYIDVDSPAAGLHWILVQNWAASAEGAEDAFTMQYALVTTESGDNLAIDVDSVIPALTPFDMRVTWDLDTAMYGDMYYGAFDMGTDADNAGNLGVVTVDIMRGADDVSVTGGSDDRLNAGDQITYAIEVAANMTPEDRNYDISLTLPEGVSLVEGSVSNDGVADGNTLSWELMQPTLLGLTPTYTVTSNATDAQCANPEFGQGGGYLDLAAFGIPFSGVNGDGQLGLFNVPANIFGTLYPSLGATDDGFVTITGDSGANPWFNQLMPNATAPNGVVAPFWRDMVVNNDAGSGISVATAGPGVTIIEWDNMEPWTSDGSSTGDILDFQVVFLNDAAPGTPNIVFSYANVTHANPDTLGVSIGVESAAADAGVTSHYVSYNGSEAPIGSIASDVVDGAQLCLYLQDVDDSPTQLTFTVEVTEDNLGGPIQMMAMSSLPTNVGTASAVSVVNTGGEVEGAPMATIDGEMTASLEVIELRDLTLPGNVVEPNGDDYEIIWRQVEGPAAVIAGNGLAEAILQAPEVTEDSMIVLEMTATDVNGNSSTATANVMVKNNQAPTISASAPSSVKEGSSVTVSVTTSDPEGDAVSVTINGQPGTSLTATAPATNTQTTMTFNVVATDGLNTTTETVTVTVTDNSGGSMGWIALLLLPLIAIRRRSA